MLCGRVFPERAQIRSFTFNSVINLHQGRNKRWHVLDVCYLSMWSSAVSTMATDTRALKALEPFISWLHCSRVSQGCSLLHLIWKSFVCLRWELRRTTRNKSTSRFSLKDCALYLQVFTFTQMMLYFFLQQRLFDKAPAYVKKGLLSFRSVEMPLCNI